MKKILFAIATAALLFSAGSVQAKTRKATFQKQAIECLGVEGDGSQTVRVTGTGKNKADAVEQAMKDAVMAVIFDGIRGGMQGCDSRPLISEMNAHDKYEDYFNIFFMDKGEYSKYVTTEDRRIFSDSRARNKYFKNIRVTVRVYRSELKARLKADGVIKK